MNTRVIPVVVSLLAAGLWLSTSFADIQDWILADDFESGNAGAWSATNGPYQVIPEAASEGAFGLRIPAVFAEPAWVMDGNPDNETVIHTDFDINFDGLIMADGDEFDLYIGWVTHDTDPAFVVSLKKVLDQYHIELKAWSNQGVLITASTTGFAGSGWHRMTVEFRVSTSPTPEGVLRVLVDGSLINELADFDNQDFGVNSLQIGAIAGVGQTISGFMDIDVYTSVRLFNPWPCATTGGDPSDGRPVCLDAEGRVGCVAVGGCGDGVVVWRGAEDVNPGRSRIGGIYGKPVRGTSRGESVPFFIVQDETSRTPAVDMDAQCNSMVAWSSSLDGEAVFTAVVGIDGTPLTPVVQVSQGTDAEQWPVVAADDGGRYLVAWRRLDNGEEFIRGRFYAPDATPLGPEFAVDTGSGMASLPDAAMNGAGEAVVVWESEGMIMSHRFDAGGGSIGIAALTPGPPDGEPAVAMAVDGGFAVVWTRLLEDRRLYLRLFDSDGAPVSAEIRVDTLDPADCVQPDIAIGMDGEITVVWSSTFAGRTSILGRTFGPDGTAVADPFILENRGRVWLPTAPTVAAAERLLVGYSAETDINGAPRGTLIGARSPSAIFHDGFESGDVSSWSGSIP